MGTAAGPKGIDFDDGAFNWISQNNVIVWGYQKFKGSHITATQNLILYPLASACAFITPQTRLPAQWVWFNNTCVTNQPPYAYNAARDDMVSLCNTANFLASYNTYYYLGSATTFTSCPAQPITWAIWKSKYSQDVGTVFSRQTPTVDELDSWVKAKLTWVEAILQF